MASDMMPPPSDNIIRTIFVDTNLDTHLAMSVSIYDTIADVKSKIAAEHALCFQDIGDISIQAIKVRRRGFFYNLVDSMYVLNAFDGVRGSWFVCIDAVTMCTVKNQKALPNEVTHEHQKHHDYTVPACSVDKYQEIILFGPSKNSSPDGLESHNLSIDHQHRPTMLIDQEKVDRLKEDGKKQNDGLHEEHLEVCGSGSKFGGGEDIDDSNKSANVFQEINYDGKKEVMATSSEGLLSKLPHEDIKSLQNLPVKKHTKKSKSKSSKSHEVGHLAMPSETAVVRSPQLKTDPKNSGKEANASIFFGKCITEPNTEESLPNDKRDAASFLEVANQKEIRHSMEVNKEPIEEQILLVNPKDRSEKHVNLCPNTNGLPSLKESAEAKVSSQVVVEFPTKLFCNADNVPSKLRHENTISFQDPLAEKHTKKRKRKSSKSHEEAHLAMPNVTVLVRSPQLTANSHNSEKDTNASIFSRKYPTEPSIEESLANDERDMSASHDSVIFLEDANKKESRHSMEINKEPIEKLIPQVSPEDQSEKHVNSGQVTSVDVSLNEPAEARVSSQVASESPTKLQFRTDKFRSRSSQLLEPKEANDQESRGSDATKRIRDLNLGEAGYVDAEVVISASAEKFPYQEQATNSVSILKGANKDGFFTNVDSKGVSKSQRRRKKSKAESSGVCESTELNGNKDHFNSDSAQVSLNDVQNESNAAELIKQAVQKANGVNSVDAMVKIPSSSKKVPKQNEVSNRNSCNPPISISNSASEVSNTFVEQAAEIRAPSLASSEVQAKPCRSRKKTKSEPSKLGSQNNCDVVLQKFNGEVTESNDGGSDPSKLVNESNPKLELHCMDARVTVPLSDENSSKLSKVPQVGHSELSNTFKVSSSVSEVSNTFVEQDAEIRTPSLASSEVQAKPCRSRKKLKSEPSKLGSQKNCDVVLQKFNGEVTESNDGGSDPSKLVNESNPKLELHCMDARVTVPLSDENSSKLSKVPQVDHSELSNTFVEQAAEIRDPSLASSEVQAKPCRSKKKTKNEPSKLRSQKNCDVLLQEFNGEVTESNDGGSDPSKPVNESNPKLELHYMDARVTVPHSDENSSKLFKVPQVDHSELSNCKLQDLAGPTKSKCDRKKSKKETLKAQVLSERSEPVSRPDNSTIKFDDDFVPREGKRSPVVQAADPPFEKSESRKRNKTSRKADISQSYQDSPTNLVQPSSYNMPIGQPIGNDTNIYSGDAVHDTGTKDSEIGIVRKVKNTKQSTKRKSSFGSIESDLSLRKAHDKHNNNELQNYEPESHVQPSKLEAMGNKQGKKITADGKGKPRSLAPDHGIDNVVSKDGVRGTVHNSSTINYPAGDDIGSNNFDASQSEVIATGVTSSDSMEDTPNQKKRYRVVRKIPSTMFKKIAINDDPEKSLLVSSGRIFSDASVTSSESENEPYKKKATIKTTLDDSSMSGDSESHREEIQAKASALKLPMDTNSFGAESNELGEMNKKADGRTKNPSRRSEASTKKVPLSHILKSSMSYRKSKLNASQSEFLDAESQQPIDVVLETQP